MKTALVTGITGQDGSFLAELLLEKNYKVIGILRRSSTPNTKNIQHIFKDLEITYGDLIDQGYIDNLVKKYKPDEIYNLGAQSFVPVSWVAPVYTAEVNALGPLKLLEAIRNHKPDTRFFQASTSEMFGKIKELPQTETTSFYPRSPYGVAKTFGHYITVNYKESYDIFASAAITFNHESVPKNSPIIIKQNNRINILPIEDMFKDHKYEGLLYEYKNCWVWNGEDWTIVNSGSCYKDQTKKTIIIQTRKSSVETTEEHHIFTEDNNEIPANELTLNTKLFLSSYPEQISTETIIDKEFAYFLGYVVGDGYIGNSGEIRLTSTDADQIIKVAEPIVNSFGFKYSIKTYGHGSYENCTKPVWQLEITGTGNFGKWLQDNIYTKYSKEKRVPEFILNANKEIKKAFFDGYYLADGRKAGNERFFYKGFTTSSATLCLGIVYIFNSFSNQLGKVKCEYRDGRRYYYCVFTTDKIGWGGNRKSQNEIISLTQAESEDGWYYDLQTESKTFATGPNIVKVHNSERRSEEFVTRKITKAVARIKLGLQNELALGNLQSKRDWGYARDYVYAFYQILQHTEPDVFVVGSGETHTIEEFCKLAFEYVHLNYVDYVRIEPKFYRPAEVDILLSNPEKIKRVLGWEAKTSFTELVQLMVEHDLKEESERQNC